MTEQNLEHGQAKDNIVQPIVIGGLPCTIFKGWIDDLIWCPSQCYLYIQFKEKNYVIYLRWRHSDPWSAVIIECIKDWDMHNGSKWEYLDISEWKDTELNQCKEDSIEKAKMFLANLL